MNWTTLADIQSQLRKLWNQGKLLAEMVHGESLFPMRLTLKKPASSELVEHFGAAREWIAALQKAEARNVRIVWRTVQHRVIGENKVPDELWVDSRNDAISLIGKRAEADRFAALLTETRERCPELLPWLARRPLKALTWADEWRRLVDVVLWLKARPRPAIYLRQVNIPGVHSKFIEDSRAVLSELLDLALPPEAIRAEASGLSNFCYRYGFLDKPSRVRFRLLDPKLAVFPDGDDQDITVTLDTYAQLAAPVRQVFITENEINFLAFPPAAASMVVFGAGYAIEALATARWLRGCRVVYWGDIDTHGFAILNRARSHAPHIESVLMDETTLLSNRVFWDKEKRQHPASELSHLTEDELAVFRGLREQRWGTNVRLEQERIPWEQVRTALSD